MEWIDPKYADVVANLRAQQAARPQEQCIGCDGQGEKVLPEAFGATRVQCRACNGTGRRPAGVRSFIMS